MRYNKQRHDFGTQQEERLKSLLEAFCGEPLTKTRHLYDIMDFESESFWIELKSRTKKYHPDDFSTWLLPSCKGDEASKNKNKKTLFFYYWQVTDDLYVLEYDEVLFTTFVRQIPSWHKEQQEHFYIPAEEFSLIQWVEG